MICDERLTAVVDEAGGEGLGCREATAGTTAESIHGYLTALRKNEHQSNRPSRPRIHQSKASYLRVSQIRNLILGTGAVVAREKLLQLIDTFLL